MVSIGPRQPATVLEHLPFHGINAADRAGRDPPVPERFGGKARRERDGRRGPDSTTCHRIEPVSGNTSSTARRCPPRLRQVCPAGPVKSSSPRPASRPRPSRGGSRARSITRLRTFTARCAHRTLRLSFWVASSPRRDPGKLGRAHAEKVRRSSGGWVPTAVTSGSRFRRRSRSRRSQSGWAAVRNCRSCA